MPYGPDGANPRKMRTQCENVDVENQNTVRTGLGAHTSDPLLKVVESIAWLTEIGPILIGALCSLLGFLGFQSFALLSLPGGVVGWCYFHFLWVRPSQHLLLGIQQLSALKFLPWMSTVFIHSLPPAFFFFCYMTNRTNTLPWRLEMIYWTFWVIVWTLILTPQFVVLAAFMRVRRLNNERRQNESASLFLEDLPPSYSTLQPSYSTLEAHTRYLSQAPQAVPV